ncbi:MAG: hypothetical protein EBU90_30465, partial [Proteobacteria bacterium]|nr:hypothetical protein [Pseudomonadota bacterium]
NASFSGLTTTNNLYVSGVGTIPTLFSSNSNLTNIYSTGISTFGITDITVNSSSNALTITQTGTGNAFVVKDDSPDSSPFVITGIGSVGIGVENPLEKLQIDGNLRLGASDLNYIAFKGTTGDSPNGGFTHTFIGERIYTPATEESELLIFKGNDHDLSTEGPDRIRLAAAEIRFDTYTTPTSGSFEEVATSGNLNTRFIIRDHGSVGIGTDNPKAKLHSYGTAGVGLTEVLGYPVNTLIEVENSHPWSIGFRRTDLGPKYDVAAFIDNDGIFYITSGDGAVADNYYSNLGISTNNFLVFTNDSVSFKVDSNANSLVYNNLLVGTQSLTGTANQNLQVNGGAYVSGNTGIGTTNPSALLDVYGDFKVSGIGTFGSLSVTGLTTTKDLQVVGITTLGVTTVTNLTAQSVNSSGLITATSFVPSSGYIKAAD